MITTVCAEALLEARLHDHEHIPARRRACGFANRELLLYRCEPVLDFIEQGYIANRTSL